MSPERLLQSGPEYLGEQTFAACIVLVSCRDHRLPVSTCHHLHHWDSIIKAICYSIDTNISEYDLYYTQVNWMCHSVQPVL